MLPIRSRLPLRVLSPSRTQQHRAIRNYATQPSGRPSHTESASTAPESMQPIPRPPCLSIIVLIDSIVSVPNLALCLPRIPCLRLLHHPIHLHHRFEPHNPPRSRS